MTNRRTHSHTHRQTYRQTDKPKAICPSNFFKVGGINIQTAMKHGYVFFCHFGHTCDIPLFHRDLPIFEQISLFGISKFPYITYTSPYFKFQISLFEIKNLLCLVILPILKSKSPYLASQMYIWVLHLSAVTFILFIKARNKENQKQIS